MSRFGPASKYVLGLGSFDSSPTKQLLTFTQPVKIAKGVRNNYGLYFDGTGFVSAPSNAIYQFGSENFKIKALVCFTDVTTVTQRLIAANWKAGGGFNERSWIFCWNKTSGNLEFICSADGIGVAATKTVSWTPTVNRFKVTGAATTNDPTTTLELRLSTQEEL